LTDGKFIKLHFKDEDVDAKEIERIPHIARYIAKRQHISARVLFSTKTFLNSLLEDLDKLHEANKNIMKEATEKFYNKILEDSSRRNVLVDTFRSRLHWEVIRASTNLGFKYYKAFSSATVNWIEAKKAVEIGLPNDENTLNFDALNTADVEAAAARAIKRVYRADVECTFVEDIPF
jgi:hypothetical protein